MKTSTRAFLVFTLLTMCVTAMSARDNTIVQGSFQALKGVTKFNVEIDWSYLHINGLSPQDWIKYRNAEQPSYDAEKEFETELKPRWMEMVKSCNEKLSKKNIFLLPEATEQPFKIIISPHNIDKKGNLEALCSIVDSDGEVIVKFALAGRGGIFGTMGNLWGDGFRSAGKNLAKMLERNMIK